MKSKIAQILLALAWLRPSQGAPILDNLPLDLDLPANPPSAPAQGSKVALPFARRINQAGSTNLVDFDQARAQFMRDNAQGKYAGVSSATEAASMVNDPATARVVSYTTEVRILMQACTNVKLNL